MKHIALILYVVVLSLAHSGSVFAQNSSAPSEPAAELETPPAASDTLSVDQARLADRFKRLEEVLGQLAEFSASNDPRRAKLLREAISQSREQDISVRFESIVKLLEDERLSAATANQKELQQELEMLLNLLLKADRDKELASERDRVRKYFREVVRLLRMQKGVRARTEGGDELPGLQEDQQGIATDTKKLGNDISDNEADKKHGAESDNNSGEEKPQPDGDSSNENPQSKPDDASDQAKPSKSGSSKPSKPQPGEGQDSNGEPGEPGDTPPSDPGKAQSQSGQSGQPGQPGQPSHGEGSGSEQSEPARDPTDRAAERLRRAAQQMEDARKELQKAEREGAADRQREALRELEMAKAELERVLRQLREEELERTLTQLAARFRKMLQLQNEVHEGTVRLDEVPQAKRDHDDEIEVARLSRQESEIVNEADKALLLLREEGSSVAFPETVKQMRDDMRQVVERLTAFKVGAITQGLEEDIIAALEETIDSLEKARKELEKKRTPPGQQPPSGQPVEPPLVDSLSELKMIRALQVRINKRTQRYGEMIEGEQAETDDLLEALAQLAERQRRVHQATADLQQSRND